MSEKVNYYLAQLDKFLDDDNKLTHYLKLAEKKTNIKKSKIFLGGVIFLMLYMWIGYGAGLLCNLIAFVYPAYASIKAVESSSKDDDTQWLTYWVVYALFGTIEFFSDLLLSWFPFYWLTKCVFLVWCAAPVGYSGRKFIYEHIIRPVFLKHEHRLDQMAQTASQLVTDATQRAQGIAAEAVLKSD